MNSNDAPPIGLFTIPSGLSDQDFSAPDCESEQERRIRQCRRLAYWLLLWPARGVEFHVRHLAVIEQNESDSRRLRRAAG